MLDSRNTKITEFVISRMKIMKIEYDLRNNSTLIQICDDSQTEYVYTPDGDKQSSIHRTASPNITVGLGENKKLAKDEILESDSTDYHGNLIVENGKPDKYMFAGGFASLRNDADGKPEIAFHYYDQDHLGNNRAVVSARTGAVEQITNYYPFGMPYTDQTAVNPDFQKYKYNGKELDKMHGLNTYDYGARQYYSIVPAWDRIDPMCEKYYSISTYVFCGGNPINRIDLNGKDDWLINNKGYVTRKYNKDGDFIYFVGGNGKQPCTPTLSFKYGTIEGKPLDNGKYYAFKVRGTKNAASLFETLATYTDVEWSEALNGGDKDNSKKGYIVTTHMEKQDEGMKYLVNNGIVNKDDGFNIFNHNHPSGTTYYPSGLDNKKSDIGFAMEMVEIFGQSIRFNIFSPDLQKYIPYGPNSKRSEFEISYPLDDVIVTYKRQQK